MAVEVDLVVTGTAIRERVTRGLGAKRPSWEMALVGHPECRRASGS